MGKTRTKAEIQAENEKLKKKNEDLGKTNEEAQKVLRNQLTTTRLESEIKVEWTRVKTALAGLGVLIASMLCLWLTGYSNEQAGVVIAYIIAVIVFVCGLVGIFATNDDDMVVGLIICIASYDKDEYKAYYSPGLLLSCIFALPLIIGIFPLSKLHNQRQLERNKKIVEMLQIDLQQDGLEILLPAEHVKENDYMERVLSVAWESHKEKQQEWKDIAIHHFEGTSDEKTKHWYKAKLPFPDWYKCKRIGQSSATLLQEEKEKYKSNTDNIILFFNHVWENYKTPKEVLFPDPNFPDPNSLQSKHSSRSSRAFFIATRTVLGRT